MKYNFGFSLDLFLYIFIWSLQVYFVFLLVDGGYYVFVCGVLFNVCSYEVFSLSYYRYVRGIYKFQYFIYVINKILFINVYSNIDN